VLSYLDIEDDGTDLQLM